MGVDRSIPGVSEGQPLLELCSLQQGAVTAVQRVAPGVLAEAAVVALLLLAMLVPEHMAVAVGEAAVEVAVGLEAQEELVARMAAAEAAVAALQMSVLLAA